MPYNQFAMKKLQGKLLVCMCGSQCGPYALDWWNYFLNALWITCKLNGKCRAIITISIIIKIWTPYWTLYLIVFCITIDSTVAYLNSLEIYFHLKSSFPMWILDMLHLLQLPWIRNWAQEKTLLAGN